MPPTPEPFRTRSYASAVMLTALGHQPIRARLDGTVVLFEFPAAARADFAKYPAAVDLLRRLEAEARGGQL